MLIHSCGASLMVTARLVPHGIVSLIRPCMTVYTYYSSLGMR